MPPRQLLKALAAFLLILLLSSSWQTPCSGQPIGSQQETVAPGQEQPLTASAPPDGQAAEPLSPDPAPETELNAVLAMEAEQEAALTNQEILDRCLALLQPAGATCSTESDTMAIHYPRYSEELPTQQQEDMALAALKQTGQPSEGCCRNLKPFADARCPCEGPFKDVLPLGGFAPAYFEGSTAILATACEIKFAPC